VQFLNNVHFQQCNYTGVTAQAAVVVSSADAGTVIVQGRVERHHARVLFAANPPTTGGEVLFAPGSSIASVPRKLQFAAANPDASFGVAAIAHASGNLDIKCATRHEFVVTQSLVGGVLFSNSQNCTLVNLTDLLLDFGAEYEVMFYEGSPRSSPATTVLNVLVVATSVTLLVTFIFHQTKLTAIVHGMRAGKPPDV
jgi:hypothetical protein